MPDFDERHGLGHAQLLELWGWTEAQFLQRTEGSPIRRIGHARWLRNIAVALGNALRQASAAERETIRAALAQHADHPDAVVCETVQWALQQV